MDGIGIGMCNEDDLMYKFGDIICVNGNVRQVILEGLFQYIIMDYENFFQYYVVIYMDNDIVGQL